MRREAYSAGDDGASSGGTPARRRGSVQGLVLVGFFLLPILVASSAELPRRSLEQGIRMDDACAVEGDAASADIVLARAACARALERFILLYGSAPAAGTLVVSDTVAFFAVEANLPRWRMVWPTSDRLRDFFADAGQRPEAVEESLQTHWTTVLPHELGHLMLTAEAEARRSSERAFRRLPDWLHEGTAVWMEPPLHRESEYAILRALDPLIPDLREMLRMRIAHPTDGGEGGSTVIQTFYPCASEDACGGRPYWDRIFSVTTRQFGDGRIQIDTTFHERAPPPPNPVAANFYAYSATLVRFIHSQGGATAMSSLLERYVRSPADESVTLAGLPGLPRSEVAVQAEWREWFRRYVFR